MTEKERPGDRIRLFRLGLDMQQDVFARQLAVSASLISLVEANQRRPTATLLGYLSTVFSVSSEWVMSAEGSPFNSPCYLDNASEVFERMEDMRRAEEAASLVKERGLAYGKGYSIPVVSQAAANPKNRIEFEDIENEWTTFPPGIVAIRITDESMSPVVWPGQFVLCDPEADVGDGDLVVAKIKYHGLLFKRVYFEKKRDLVMLHSVNQARNEPPLIVDQADVEYRFKVIGAKFE